LFDQADARDETMKSLVKAADQFIVKRDINESPNSVSILAGFHWFADWGRDTFISLPGLLLDTGRTDEAKEVLLTFAHALDEGMIPNRFDDYGGAPHYNSVDASLWFIQAAYQYLRTTEDNKTFTNQLRPAITEIVSRYQSGTRFNIRSDEDGLITAGDPETQLTWMDARCNGVSFTPRHGKPVEINALWINALHIMAETASDQQERERYARLAETAEQNFVRLFWNFENNCLNDCILTDGRVDAAIRPNQIFAVSLPFSPLDEKYQFAVVNVVKDELLTPYGLRSLSPRDSRYRGRYIGDQFQRDSVYHQGTVWAFLLGPFIEAYLKVHSYSEEAKAEAGEMMQPLLRHIDEDGCLGSINEIFDGDWPHRPSGCVAQAWSVAALIRCYKLLADR
jgi:predicted glycogen debranching enzyme